MIWFLVFLNLSLSYADSRFLEQQRVTWPAVSDAPVEPMNMWRGDWKRESHFLKNGEETIYDFVIQRDTNGFRNIEDTLRKKDLRYHIFTGGCSFTFGVGVKDEETFSAQISPHLPKTRVVNMGVGGASVSEQYYLWKYFSWEKVFKEEDGLYIYTFMRDHPNRLKRTWVYYRRAHPSTPYFEKENGELVYQGTISSTLGYRWSQVIERNGLSLWWLRGVSHFLPLEMRNGMAEFAFYIAETKREYLKKFPKGRFVLSWFQHNQPWTTPEEEREFRKVMKDQNIELWEEPFRYDYFLETGAYATRHIPFDGHPSEFAHKEYSEFLLRKIKSTTSQPTL